jgi:hypothetical protein
LPADERRRITQIEAEHADVADRHWRHERDVRPGHKSGREQRRAIDYSVAPEGDRRPARQQLVDGKERRGAKEERAEHADRLQEDPALVGARGHDDEH